MTNTNDTLKAYRALTPNQQFFYDHAGWSYDPKTETSEQGKIRCAKDLAAAEEFAQELEWGFCWEPDECIGCDCGSSECACSTGELHESLCCILRNLKGDVLASLGAICSPTLDYARVVKAELASEAMTEQLRIAQSGEALAQG